MYVCVRGVMVKRVGLCKTLGGVRNISSEEIEHRGSEELVSSHSRVEGHRVTWSRVTPETKSFRLSVRSQE